MTTTCKFLLVCLMACIRVFHVQAQNAIPYMPMRADFGGRPLTDLKNFVPNSGDYTLEIKGTRKQPIIIEFSQISYTPTLTGTVRFAQKAGKVYVFEEGVFKTVLTPAPNYTSGKNLLQNPSFEIVSEELAPGKWIPSGWETWNGGAPTWGAEPGKTNVIENRQYNSEGSKSVAMASESRQLLQGLPENSLSGNTYYLLTYDHWTSPGNGNGESGYQVALRKNKYSLDIHTFSGHSTSDGDTVKSSFSTIFQTPANMPANVWFVLQRNTSKADWLDNFKLYKIQPGRKGLSGVRSGVYLAGTAIAPGNLKLIEGNYMDITSSIVNPRFDNGTLANGAPAGWSYETVPSRPSTIQNKAKGNLIEAGQNHWQIGGNSGKTQGKAYQTIANLPNGKYFLQAAVVPNPFSGNISLYANTGKTALTSGTGAIYETTGVVFDGTLEIGLEIATNNSPTLDLDNFSLRYLGMDDEGYVQVLEAKLKAARADTAAMAKASGQPGYNNLSQFRDAFTRVARLSDRTATSLIAVLPLIDSAMNTYDAIIEAYKPLKESIDQFKKQLASSDYPLKDKNEFNALIVQAQSLYSSKQDQRAKIKAMLQSLAAKRLALTQYDQLQESISSAVSLQQSTGSPQKADFQQAVDAARAVLNNPHGADLPTAIKELRLAKANYYNTLFSKPAIKQLVSRVDTDLRGSEKFVLRVDDKPFYMTNIQIRLDKLKGYLGWSDGALEAVIKRAAEDGFNTVSIPVNWREVEPAKDEFDWTTLDRYMGWCKKYGVKMELLWFSWSSGGRIQWLIKNDKTDVNELRVPDYVCTAEGTSEFTVRRKTDPWTLDWYDKNLRDRDKYVLQQVMEHIAVWDANNGNPHTMIGVQLGNEAHGHDQEVSAAHIIDYFDYVGAAVKESKYVVWTRLNCVSWMTKERIKANENKRNQEGTNIDFVGIDIYGTNAAAILGDMNDQMPHLGKNYSMIMEIDAKDGASPVYQMAALAGNKAFDYYNMAAVDGNQLYTNEGTKLVERPHIAEIRQRNKILNLANQDIALKAHGKSLYAYNYAGNSMTQETGIEGISFKPVGGKSQAIAVRRSASEIVLLATNTGIFTWPSSLRVASVSKGSFDKDNKWIKEEELAIKGNTISMPETSAVLLKLK